MSCNERNKSLEKALEIESEVSRECLPMKSRVGMPWPAAIGAPQTMLMEQLPGRKTFLLAIWYSKCQQTANLKREKITFLICYIVLNWILLSCHVLLCHFMYWLLTGWNRVVLGDCNLTKSNQCYWTSRRYFSSGVLESRGGILS